MKKEVLNVSMPDYLNETAAAQAQEASPFELLNAAAAQMEKMTGGKVKAEVYLAPFLGTIRYTFYLVIPLLNDYTDPLFYVWTTQPDQGYPVHLLESGADQSSDVSCEDDVELAKSLEQIFGSAWVRSRIRQWIEMAEERGGIRQGA